jgi:hypothetical protein
MAVHRGGMAQRMEVGQRWQLPPRHLPQHVPTVVGDNELAAAVVLEQLRERRPPIGVASPLLGAMERPQGVALAERLARPRGEDEGPRACARRRPRFVLESWPSRRWLTERAGSERVLAIWRSGGPGRWAAELGLPLRHLRGQRWTAEMAADALEPLLAGRSAWPSRLQFERAGLSGGCGLPFTTPRGMRRWLPATG